MFRTILRLIFIILNNLYCIPTYLIWMFIIHPFKPACPRLYDSVEGTLYSWLLEMVSFWIWSANVVVHEAGDNLDECIHEKSVVVCNHQSTADVPVLMSFMSSKHGMTRRVSWLMDMMFKHTNFGWVSQVHHDFFIKQGKDTRNEQLTRLEEYLRKYFSTLNRKWLMLFPEGGFFYKRKESSQKYAAKNGFAHLDYCTLPRTGALWTILSTLVPGMSMLDNKQQQQQDGESSEQLKNNNSTSEMINDPDKHIKWIVDLTVCYPKRDAPSILDLIGSRNFSPSYNILIICRKYPISQVQDMTGEQFQTWMYDRWAEKDNMLRVYYESGQACDATIETCRVDAFCKSSPGSNKDGRSNKDSDTFVNGLQNGGHYNKDDNASPFNGFIKELSLQDVDNNTPDDHNNTPGSHNNTPDDHNNTPDDHNNTPDDHNIMPDDHNNTLCVTHNQDLKEANKDGLLSCINKVTKDTKSSSADIKENQKNVIQKAMILPQQSLESQEISTSPIRMVALHSFFILSSYLHYRVIYHTLSLVFYTFFNFLSSDISEK